jgi:hypothetical protein
MPNDVDNDWYEHTSSEANYRKYQNGQRKRIATGIPDKMTKSKLDTLPKIEYTIERLLIAPGNLSILCGTGCSGKTMFMQYLSCCISCTGDQKLFGKYPVAHGGVIHIDQEQSKAQTLKRYIRLANGLDADIEDITRVPLDYRLDDPSLSAKAVEQELVELFTGKTLAFVDSLKASSVADENSSSIDILLKMLKRVAEKAECAVVVVHHKGKGKDAKQTGRGSSAIYDSADLQIGLDSKDNIYEVKCEKTRERYFPGFKFTLLDEGEYNENQKCSEKLVFQLLEDDIKSTEGSMRDRIIDVLLKNNELNKGGLYDLIGGDKTAFDSLIKGMEADKSLIIRTGTHNAKICSLNPAMIGY